jgi:ubiquinone/menaquinone biosynthesis C-methylase UbiE
MDPKLQRRVQRYGWDKAASLYEQYWQDQLWPAQDLLLELAELAPGEHVLEVASGTGLVTFPAAAAVGPSGSVLATDISDAMLDELQRDARAQGFTNVPTRRMDAEALDVPPDSFDVALCALGLMYVPDPVAALAQMCTALKPGGRAVCAVWGARSHCGWADIFPIVDARVQSEVCPMFFSLGTGDALAAAMQAAGFTDVITRRISTVLHYESADDACGAAFAGGPVALAYSRFDKSTRDAAHAEYLQSIDRWRSGPQFNVPGEFVVCRGRRLTPRSPSPPA